MVETPPISVAMIAAMAQNRVIGRDNQLPWHLPNDLKHFKVTTMGKPIVMGRKTFESIGRPLPGRTNIVVTGNHDFNADGVQIVYSIADAVEMARNIAQADNAAEVVVIGGAQLYRAMLPEVTRLYLTQVQTNVSGDAFFPELDWTQWLEVERQEFWFEGVDSFAYNIAVYERVC